jgi:ribonuclease HII
MYNEAMILGIDEVGRGPWAGPLVIGAVVLNGPPIEGLTDSKKLTARKRETLAETILKQSAYGLGWVDASEIDKVGLSAALTLACRRAVEQVKVPYHEIIIDGTVNFLNGTSKGPYVTTLKKADLLIASVSAASIIAKVARDDYMAAQEEVYPGYRFDSHVGYGTAAHRAAIERLGLTPLHRRSFAPIRALAGASSIEKPSIVGTNKHAGNKAEDQASAWLEQQGYVVVERNWKTRFCEIDIIATKDRAVHFVEVKHRRSVDQGGGLAAITPAKLRQMKFAANLYLARLPAVDARLAVISTSGTDKVTVDELLTLE